MDNPIARRQLAVSCWSTGTKNLDVHYSSGVGNHFFYLLAEGSGAKTIGDKAHNSPTCNGSTVVGIGRSDAQRIWYRALTVYMTSGTTTPRRALHPERRERPVRCQQHAAGHGRRCLERGQRRLTSERSLIVGRPRTERRLGPGASHDAAVECGRRACRWPRRG